MTFEHTLEIPADRAHVWEFVLDLPRVARCVPGLESIEPLGDGRYAASVKVRIGPIALKLSGIASIVAKDEAGGNASLLVDAADKRAGGGVKARMDLFLSPESTSVTRLKIVTDAQVLGKIGDFGQPAIRKKADAIVAQIAENMREALR